MAVNCKNCGTELFPGQRFCRVCGTATDQYWQEDATTKVLPQNQARGAQTGELKRGTDPVRPPQTNYSQPYQTPYTVPLTAVSSAPPRRRSHWRWAIPLALLAIIVCALLAAIIAFVNTSKVQVVRNVQAPSAPPAPPKPDNGAVIKEDNADVSNSETVINKTFPLGDNASVSIKNMEGDITIEGTDEKQADVTITKRGGSPEERKAMQIVVSSDKSNLSLVTAQTNPSSGIKVSYEVKLPRKLRQLEINSQNSKVKLADLTAMIGIDLTGYQIELEDVSGTIKTNLVKGNTKISYGDTPMQGPQQFSAIRGNIEIEFGDKPNVDLKAETVDGKIEADEDLGLKVEKRVVGQQATGRIGQGGQQIYIKAVNGNIKLKK